MPILIEYFKTGLVPRIPTLVVSILAALVSAQLFTCGLILDTNTKNARQSFEVCLNMIRTMIKDRENE